MMKPQTALKAGIIISMAVVMIFLMSAAAPAMSSSQQANSFTSQANLIPNPYLDVNITWNNFYKGWNPLEYSNGTANLTLPTDLSVYYKNPITVNPADIKSKALQNDNLSGGPVWDASAWGQTGLAGGAVGTNGISGTSIYQTANTSDSAAYGAQQSLWIPVTDFPSNNPNYNFLTVIVKLSGPQMSGVNGVITLWNSSGHDYVPLIIYPGQYAYLSESLGTIQKDIGYATTFNTTGKGATTNLGIDSTINLPETSTAATYNMSITGLAFGTTPMTLGTAWENGSLIQVNRLDQAGRLQTFNPDFAWSEIANSGYSVATSQRLQNLTTQQSEISGTPHYVEQVTYEGNYYLPSAPGLSYSSAAISEKFNVSTSQTTVLDINGVSLLNTISGKNGTVTLETVNPNQKTSLIQIVDYTSSQWTAVSGPPGLFSEAGFEYYFDVFILGIMALIGLTGGAAAIHLRNLRRVR